MNGTDPRALTCGNHYDPAVEPSPVFADPSGRRHRLLRVAGIGSTAVLVAFLVAVVMAVTGGPQAPFTQWAVPQPSASRAAHGGDQALTGGNGKSGAPTGSSGTGGGPSAGGHHPRPVRHRLAIEDTFGQHHAKPDPLADSERHRVARRLAECHNARERPRQPAFLEVTQAEVLLIPGTAFP